ncbi:hypothetical protein ACPOLB_25880 [Rubrivivax sp. RP6-9]|uniref:hypothetical protein n=1 Tax=Rubrivivax sp. RP6-9 TaxID=3415750 RepID=UPI003CC55B22
MLAIALLAGVAQAQTQTITIKVPDDIPLPVSKVARAEVLADLHMWRLAGLQELNRGEGSTDFHAPEYRKAQARYEWLIASPQYATLVAELSQRSHAAVHASRN